MTRRSDVIWLFITLLVTAGCNDRVCTDGEEQIMNASSKSNDPHQVKLSSVFPFEWDELYVVSGPRFPDEVKELTGLDYKEMIPDDARQYIFVNDGLIVRDEQSRCTCLEYLSMTGSAVTKYAYNSSIAVSCKDVEGEKICRVETQ
jgi:hypothetical protein